MTDLEKPKLHSLINTEEFDSYITLHDKLLKVANDGFAVIKSGSRTIEHPILVNIEKNFMNFLGSVRAVINGNSPIELGDISDICLLQAPCFKYAGTEHEFANLFLHGMVSMPFCLRAGLYTYCIYGLPDGLFYISNKVANNYINKYGLIRIINYAIYGSSIDSVSIELNGGAGFLDSESLKHICTKILILACVPILINHTKHKIYVKAASLDLFNEEDDILLRKLHTLPARTREVLMVGASDTLMRLHCESRRDRKTSQFSEYKVVTSNDVGYLYSLYRYMDPGYSKTDERSSFLEIGPTLVEDNKIITMLHEFVKSPSTEFRHDLNDACNFVVKSGYN